MGFLHVLLLGGTLLAAAPVILHLVMRQQPKLLEFPALRFIQQRRESNRRRLRLRHWLLLALRVAAIVLLALGLSRPFVRTSSAWIGDREAPVAAALLFDTSARMEYRQRNQTRLEQAQEIGEWLLKQLPDESQAAVLDSRPAPAAFQVDLTAARQRVSRLEITPVTRTMPEAIESAAELLARSELERKEIYLFTDLTKAAFDPAGFDPAGFEAARQAVEALGGAAIYVIDVGVESPKNISLGSLQLSGQRLPRNRPLRIETDVASVGEAGERSVEAYVLSSSGAPELRSRRPVDVSAGGAARVEFMLTGLEPGMIQGDLKLAGGADALPIDDIRYFSVEVRPPQRVLIATASPDAEDRARLLVEALSPTTMRESGQAPYQCDVISTDKLEEIDLDTQSAVSYSAVLLNDPRPLTAAAWRKLHAYAHGGGGVGIFLGPSADPLADFNSPAALDVLPGKLLRQARYPDGELTLAPNTFEHPLLSPFRTRGGTMPWIDFPIYRYWQLDVDTEHVTALIPFSNGQPALLERIIGAGRVVTLTTPFSQTQDELIDDELKWNDSTAPLPSFVLVNDLTLYLTGSGDARFNYLAGEDVILRLPPGVKGDTCLVTAPGGGQFRVNTNLAERTLTIATVEQPGHYRVNAGDAFNLGFSVNLPPADTDLTRADPEMLKSLFGEVPFRVARSSEQINRELSLGRVGRELFPILALLVALVLGIEQVIANRFYRDRATKLRRESTVTPATAAT